MLSRQYFTGVMNTDRCTLTIGTLLRQHCEATSIADFVQSIRNQIHECTDHQLEVDAHRSVKVVLDYGILWQ